MTNVSKHAESRIRNRIGLNKKGTQKNAEKALEDGIRHGEVTGKLRSYMDGVFLSHRRANNMRIYHHQVYLFRGSTLITVWPLPQHLCSAADSIAKKKETNELKKTETVSNTKP